MLELLAARATASACPAGNACSGLAPVSWRAPHLPPWRRQERSAISERERALLKVEAKLEQIKRVKPRIDLLELKNFVTKNLFDVVALLKVDRLRTKNELRKHLEELRMIPTRADDGRLYYSGEGRWEIGAGSIWMNDCKVFKTEAEGIREAVESKGQVSGVRSVAGGGFEPPPLGV